MIYRTEHIAELLEDSEASDPLIITPQPNLALLKEAGAASVDLRLGSWFAELKRTRMDILDIREKEKTTAETTMVKKCYVPFGERFILHPRAFVLGVTLEWLRLPKDIAGYVTSRSSWGRRGLIIATASGVHPGFSGCLTLELTNVGEVPIALYPGTDICQFFMHHAQGAKVVVDQSPLIGQRQPRLGTVQMDEFATALSIYGSGAQNI